MQTNSSMQFLSYLQQCIWGFCSAELWSCFTR